MKIFIKAALLTVLTIGFFQGNASAESLLASKCSSFGDLNANENPSYQHLNCLLTNAALNADIPPEVVKAIATQENGGWKQFDENGQPVISEDGGIGIMQITNQTGYNQEDLKNDIYYNIESGVKILSSMYNRKDLPKIKGATRHDIENWYFPVMAYNGTKPVNSPLYKDDGTRNFTAYQEKVFAKIEHDSFLNGTKMVRFPFKTTDFQYDINSDANIKFVTMVYILTEKLHPSSYFYKSGEKVVTTIDNANLRLQPGTSTSIKVLGKFTPLTINGIFTFDQNRDRKNQFVWYKVNTRDNQVGYISSAYLTTPSCTPCLQYHKGQKIYWNGAELKPGQIGRLTVLKDTSLVKADGTFVRTLKKGEFYRIYNFKTGFVGVGGGLYVGRDTAKIKYETPSKAKLDAVKCIANFYK
ncbi:transglycosylase SLT domain-containing protein [Neobacillus drentensis]|uniref:SH3 domain-containing protein n=1 Tax=Neobacillus drentensis TaxID=220684 RepID=UPI00300343BD